MLLSSTHLSKTLETYQKEKRENTTGNTITNSMSAGAASAFTTGMLILSVIFFVMEIILIFYAILIAFSCTEGGPERIVHVFLAVFFTIPYILLMIVFNKCAGETLRGNGKWVNPK